MKRAFKKAIIAVLLLTLLLSVAACGPSRAEKIEEYEDLLAECNAEITKLEADIEELEDKITEAEGTYYEMIGKSYAYVMADSLAELKASIDAGKETLAQYKKDLGYAQSNKAMYEAELADLME